VKEETLGRWAPYLEQETRKPYFETLSRLVLAAEEKGPVYPPEGEVYAAFRLTPPERVRAVILGQDPYHEPGQAHGLAFSVRPGVKLPPSLRNILKELQADIGTPAPASGCLTPWAERGVLLLNTVLTVSRGEADSHRDFGWQTFTDAAVAAIAAFPQPVAFVLWGAQAQKKAASAQNSPYPRLILASPHPSPLSAHRGFFGSRPFSRINEFLLQNGEAPIDWSL
jgi:uracil-DNA glycosylase